VIQQVAVPRTVCSQPTYVAPPPTSGAGGLMGAIAGGALGSTIGHGTGTAAAVLIGTVGGAILGNNIEANGQRPQAIQNCGTGTTYENRPLGYNVVYEYAGRQYSTRTQTDPGSWIPLNVQPAVPGMAPPYPTGASYDGGRYGYGNPPGVVVATPPGPPVYVTPPATVIEYRDSYGYPYRPPRHYHDRY